MKSGFEADELGILVTSGSLKTFGILPVYFIKSIISIQMVDSAGGKSSGLPHHHIMIYGAGSTSVFQPPSPPVSPIIDV